MVLRCDVTTIADEARTRIIVFYHRSTGTGYKAQTLPNQWGNKPPTPLPLPTPLGTGIVMFLYLATFDASKFLLQTTVCIFLKYSCSMIVISKLVACDSGVDLYVLYLPIFCELTSRDYVPKMRIRMIEKALDVGSHRTFELFHTFVQ